MREHPSLASFALRLVEHDDKVTLERLIGGGGDATIPARFERKCMRDVSMHRGESRRDEI